MPESRFEELGKRLRTAGISKGNAKRAALEMEDHFNQLVAEAAARGDPEREARRRAHEVLGSDEVLIKRYLSRPELLAWPRRWPALWFTFVPLACYLALSVAIMAILVLGLENVKGYLHAIKVAPGVSQFIARAVSVIFLGLLPACVAAAFGIWAKRRRISLRWPLIGILIVSILASLINVDFVITGGPSAGYAGAGIGISMKSLFAQMVRAIAVGVFGTAPLWIAIRRSKGDSDPAMI
jgi:hypothetical protein